MKTGGYGVEGMRMGCQVSPLSPLEALWFHQQTWRVPTWCLQWYSFPPLYHSNITAEHISRKTPNLICHTHLSFSSRRHWFIKWARMDYCCVCLNGFWSVSFEGPAHFHYMDSQRLFFHLRKMIVSIKERKSYPSWMAMKVSKWWENGNFWVDISLNMGYVLPKKMGSDTTQ